MIENDFRKQRRQCRDATLKANKQVKKMFLFSCTYIYTIQYNKYE
jgi:hypothetical protein